MNSKEELEKLLHSHICYDCTADKDCCKTCDSRLCYEAVKKDLEVLEILKRHLVVETEDDERKELGESVNCYLKSWLSSDKEDYQKVKEWLKQ